MPTPLLYDSHMHTPLCKHAKGMPTEYAAQAVEQGLKGIIFTCHSPMPDGWWPRVRMPMDQFDYYVEMVDAARQEYEGRLDVRLGLESDYFPGMENWLKELHQKAEFHHILGSVHFFAPEYDPYFENLNSQGCFELYFNLLADSAETGLFDTLAHPDLIKNHDPAAWEPGGLAPVVAEALDRIAATGVAMELNTSGAHKRFPEMNPASWILEMMADRKIPVVLGSDSHVPWRVGESFGRSLKMIRSAGYEEVSYFLERKRQTLAIDDALESLPFA